MADEAEHNENLEAGIDEPRVTGDEPDVAPDLPADRPASDPAMGPSLDGVEGSSTEPPAVEPPTDPPAEPAAVGPGPAPADDPAAAETILVAEPTSEPAVPPADELAEEPSAEGATGATEAPAPQEPEEPSEPTGEEPEPAEPTGEESEADAQDESVDDVAAAVAAASENVQGESTFDDIAPGTVAAEGAAAVEVVHDRSANAVSIWPFVVYDLFWAAFAGLLIWQFQTLPAGTPVYEAELYPTALLVGVILVGAGPLLILVSWIASWGKPGSTKGRLFISALVKGSVATLLGVTMWWAALMVLDQIRLGTPL